MKFNKFVFPSPESSYTEETMNGELIWVPYLGKEYIVDNDVSMELVLTS